MEDDLTPLEKYLMASEEALEAWREMCRAGDRRAIAAAEAVKAGCRPIELARANQVSAPTISKLLRRYDELMEQEHKRAG